MYNLCHNLTYKQDTSKNLARFLKKKKKNSSGRSMSEQ